MADVRLSDLSGTEAIRTSSHVTIKEMKPDCTGKFSCNRTGHGRQRRSWNVNLVASERSMGVVFMHALTSHVSNWGNPQISHLLWHDFSGQMTCDHLAHLI